MRQSSSNYLQLISSFHPLPVCIPHPSPSSLPLPNPSLLLLLMFSLCSPIQIYCWLNWVTLHNFKVPCTHHLYINLACLSVRLYPINVKRLKRSGPNFVWDLTWPQGRVMNDQNLKNLCLKVFYFFIKSAKFFSSLLLNVYNENTFTMGIEDGREAP